MRITELYILSLYYYYYSSEIFRPTKSFIFNNNMSVYDTGSHNRRDIFYTIY